MILKRVTEDEKALIDKIKSALPEFEKIGRQILAIENPVGNKPGTELMGKGDAVVEKRTASSQTVSDKSIREALEEFFERVDMASKESEGILKMSEELAKTSETLARVADSLNALLKEYKL